MPMVDSSLAEREEVPITSKDVPAPHALLRGTCRVAPRRGQGKYVHGKSSQVKDHHIGDDWMLSDFVKLRRPFTSRLSPGLRLVRRSRYRYSRGVPAGFNRANRQTETRKSEMRVEPRPCAMTAPPVQFGPWGQRRPMASPAPR